jgi:hypothetical protein
MVVPYLREIAVLLLAIAVASSAAAKPRLQPISGQCGSASGQQLMSAPSGSALFSDIEVDRLERRGRAPYRRMSGYEIGLSKIRFTFMDTSGGSADRCRLERKLPGRPA